MQKNGGYSKIAHSCTSCTDKYCQNSSGTILKIELKKSQKSQNFTKKSARKIKLLSTTVHFRLHYSPHNFSAKSMGDILNYCQRLGETLFVRPF